MTEDFLAVVQEKRFLGREFLTWLVYRIEADGGRFEVDGAPVELSLGDRVVLEGGEAKNRLTLTGPGDVRAEMGAGLRRGKLLDRARLVVRRGERHWELTLDGGLLVYEALRCPALGAAKDEGPDDPRAALENDLFLRLADVEEAVGVVDVLFADFCRLRGASAWATDILPALRAWVDTLR